MGGAPIEPELEGVKKNAQHALFMQTECAMKRSGMKGIGIKKARSVP